MNNQNIPDDPNVKVEKIKPNGTFTNYIFKAIPLAFDESMSYYETLCALLNYLEETVIPAVNNNGDAVIELQNLYVELHDYVEHYFDNLDVQEEINNKLDEMAEDGTLADMVAEYIKMQGQLVYNSVEEMKQAENIQNGSFLKTYGFYSWGDGGGALYKARTITNIDVIDNAFIIALHDENLVAELITENGKVSLKQCGAYGDGIHDDTNAINKAINKCDYVIADENSVYLTSETITIDKVMTIDLNGATIKGGYDPVIKIDIPHTEIIDGVGGILKNLTIECDNNLGLLIEHAYQGIFENIRFTNVKKKACHYKAGWENQFRDFFIFGSTDTENDTVGIDVDGGDSNFIGIRGYDIKHFIIAKSINIYSDIHAWLYSSSLFSGSRFFTFSGGMQRLDNVYSDTYETAFYFSQIVTVSLLNTFVLIGSNFTLTDAYAFYFPDGVNGERYVSVIGGMMQGDNNAQTKLKLRNTSNNRRIKIEKVEMYAMVTTNGTPINLTSGVSELVSNNNSTIDIIDGIYYIHISCDVDLSNENPGDTITIMNSSNILTGYDIVCSASLSSSKYGQVEAQTYCYLDYPIQIKVPETAKSYHVEVRQTIVRNS